MKAKSIISDWERLIYLQEPSIEKTMTMIYTPLTDNIRISAILFNGQKLNNSFLQFKKLPEISSLCVKYYSMK
ncbi:hypothetical protein [Chryseobacterium sp. ON_d1]|uniref:hypothetical protein n=1 Tax=Chryseobacterium sp. ON_d1 TaxID=2583211 RepID=UPI001156D498|nr:hypothetical protein [Chryseobacterium sp. ON_d1]